MFNDYLSSLPEFSKSSVAFGKFAFFSKIMIMLVSCFRTHINNICSTEMLDNCQCLLLPLDLNPKGIVATIYETTLRDKLCYYYQITMTHGELWK